MPKVIIDDSELSSAVSSLPKLLADVSNLPSEVIDPFFRAVEHSPGLLSVIVCDDPASGAGDLKVSIQPSEVLLELVSAIATLKRIRSRCVEVLRHVA